MKNSFFGKFIGSLLILVLVSCPRLVMAQRFNHSSFGGGGGRPAFTPAPRQEAPRPAVSRPQPAPNRPQQEVSRPQQPTRQPDYNRPSPAPRPESINGGSRNFGNHDFNRTVTVHENVTVHQNVNVHENINNRGRGNMHENVNIYHTGGYRGIHPYYYHPFRPSYWGANWHPVGFFLASLAADAVAISIANHRYYYEDGSYYTPTSGGGGGYSVVPPPIGAVISYLPEGYETTMVGNDTFYYYGGAFYVNTDQGYQVVDAPPGAVITQVPVGAVEQDVNDQQLLVYNNVYYQPISQDGQDAYEVVPPPGN